MFIFIKVVERLGFWLIWLGVVLWVIGLWLVMMDELDDIGWKFGNVYLMLCNFVEGGMMVVLVLVVVLWILLVIEL